MVGKLSIEMLTKELKIIGYELLEICPNLDVYIIQHGGCKVFESCCPYKEEMHDRYEEWNDRYEEWKGIKYPVRLGCPRIYSGKCCFKIRDRMKQN